MKKVSVIIPVYNGEKYIEECLESILSQTYKNIEIIVVDDGSTDNTKQILENYKNKIMLKCQKNSGASTTRNNGYKLASGEYILFFDADDYMTENYIKNAVNIMNEGYDLVITNFNRFDETGKIKPWEFMNKKGLTEYETLYLIPHFPNNKLYKKTIIDDNKIEFKKYIMAEDANFFLKYIQNTKKIGFNNSFDIFYREHSNSITTKYSLNILDVEGAYNDLEKYIKKENKNIFACSRLYHYHCQLIKYSYYNKNNRQEIIKFFKKGFKDNKLNKMPIRYKKIMFKYYLNVWCMLFLPKPLKVLCNMVVLKKIL